MANPFDDSETDRDKSESGIGVRVAPTNALGWEKPASSVAVFQVTRLTKGRPPARSRSMFALPKTA